MRVGEGGMVRVEIRVGSEDGRVGGQGVIKEVQEWGVEGG